MGRVDAGERVQQLPRRDDLVQPAQQLRALDALAQRGLAGQEERGRAEDPDQGEPGGCAENEAPAVSNARSGGKRSPERKNEPAIEPSASSTNAQITAPPSPASGV